MRRVVSGVSARGAAPAGAKASGERSIAQGERLLQRLRAIASITLVFYGLLLLTAAVLGIREQAGLPTAPSWSVLHLIVALALAIGLLRGERWAWWGAAALGGIALLLLAPLWTALVGGPGLTLLLPRADLALVAMEALSLAYLLLLLAQIRRAERASSSRPR